MSQETYVSKASSVDLVNPSPKKRKLDTDLVSLPSFGDAQDMRVKELEDELKQVKEQLKLMTETFNRNMKKIAKLAEKTK